MGPGSGFPYGDWERDIQAISDWLVKSPLKTMFDNDVTECRFDLTDAGQVAPYPLLGEARDLGGTDYVGFLTPFVTGVELPDSVHDLDGLMTSWVTDRTDGFAPKHLRALLPLWQ